MDYDEFSGNINVLKGKLRILKTNRKCKQKITEVKIVNKEISKVGNIIKKKEETNKELSKEVKTKDDIKEDLDTTKHKKKQYEEVKAETNEGINKNISSLIVKEGMKSILKAGDFDTRPIEIWKIHHIFQ
ncbi:hypothetical protein H8356DRAFT_1354055 [Neocallimastix lanati (nom. inval.)]|nr:hypothetical protein H8356DRAFT_1354055 [Neocallimastix sp. JGI-2020a]